MSTYVEKTPTGTIYRAAKDYPIPNLDVLSLLFDSAHSYAQPHTPLHISAANPHLALTKSRCRDFTQSTSAALRKHFNIGADGPGRDVVSVVSTGHYLLPVLAYGVIGAGGVFSAASAGSTVRELSRLIQGAGSRILVTCQSTLDTTIKAPRTRGGVLVVGGGWWLWVKGRNGGCGL